MSIDTFQKTLGRRHESEASYKAALGLDPGNAEAYWSLADLKNYSFSDSEVAAMQSLLASDKGARSSEAQLNLRWARLSSSASCTRKPSRITHGQRAAAP